MQNMKCLLIEDEEIFRIQLKALLAEVGGFEVIGEATDCRSGLELIRAHPEVELLFLDVELPDGTSFDIITQLDKLPKLLFVTSHDSYALSAFEVNALDYIQKPLSLERLVQALDRLDHPMPLIDEKLPALNANDLVLFCSNRHKYFTNVSEITAILSDENYTHVIRSDGRRFIMKKTLRAWEEQLPSELFMRLGRQQLINISALDRMEIRERGGQLWFKGIADPIKLKHAALKNLQQLAKLI
jgi:two-component system LytT family response regulator